MGSPLLVMFVASWPASGAPLDATPSLFPPQFGIKRVYLDAGHGYATNTGNVSVRCELEETFTLRASRELASRLEKTGHFQVRLSRAGLDRSTSYEARVADAERWGAHVFLSLHSDARGAAWPVAQGGGRRCFENASAPGFAILWNDDAGMRLNARRGRLARALARWMGSAGFLAYDGRDYASLYDPDPVEPGVFIDRRRGRVYVLRKPRMPSAIIETHHALDPQEVARWDEPVTHDAFAASVVQALIDALP